MPKIPGTKVKISKRGLVLISAVIVVLLLALSLGGDETNDVHEGANDCIEYVRRGCCQEPDLERCQQDQLGWEREEDPFEFCCDETMT
ncbi:MAG: hypothetical protein ACLFQ8_01260 [Candidatus Aenigmatarchaeota archaeon]